MKIFLLIIMQVSTFAFVCPTNKLQISNNDKSTVMTNDSGDLRIWNEADRHDLTYCISNRFKDLKPVITEALKIATSNWMETGNITFKYVPDEDESCDNRKGPKTRFRIAINTSRRYPYAGRAFFPYDERKTITFKKSYVEKSFNELLRLTRHELGHVLGLRHEHIRYENPRHKDCSEDDFFAAVNDYDNNSIMHYSRCGGTGTLVLSENDKEGVSLLYP